MGGQRRGVVGGSEVGEIGGRLQKTDTSRKKPLFGLGE